MADDAPGVLTVGHSTHPASVLVDLLVGQHVDLVVDVRSSPYSRFSRQHNQEELRGSLTEAGIAYRHMGGPLGGRPADPDLYDDAGHVRYDLVARTEAFRAAIDVLMRLEADHTIALLCAEEDPTGCHRRLLVGRALGSAGVRLNHIRGDGRLQADDALETQLALFDRDRSTAPVRRP